jgi:hypothetical protein
MRAPPVVTAVTVNSSLLVKSELLVIVRPFEFADISICRSPSMTKVDALRDPLLKPRILRD